MYQNYLRTSTSCISQENSICNQKRKTKMILSHEIDSIGKRYFSVNRKIAAENTSYTHEKIISVRQNSQSSREVQDQQLSPFWYVLAIDFSEFCASTKPSHLYQSHWIELILKVLQYTRKRRCFNFTMLAIWWSLRSMYIIINLLYSTRESGVQVCGGTVHT